MTDEVSLDFLARQLERALDRLGSVERGLGALREEMQGVCDRVDAVVMSSRRLEREHASAGEQPRWSLTQVQAVLVAEAIDYIEAGRGHRGFDWESRVMLPFVGSRTGTFIRPSPPL